MLLHIIAPLLFSSALYTAPITRTVTDETQQVHTEEKEEHAYIPDEVACSCVATVRTKRHDIPLVNAEDIHPTSSVPTVGAVAKMVYPSGAHHLAYVEDVRDGQVYLFHGNRYPCQFSREWMDASNYRIRGYL